MKITSNLAQVDAKFKLLVNRIPIALKQSCKIVANDILEDSLTKSPSCPEDTGALRSTGRVEPVKEGYAVAYGGLADDGTYVDYAGYVNDDLRPRKYKLPGSGPKFVETHVWRRSAESPAKIAAVLRDLINGIISEGR